MYKVDLFLVDNNVDIKDFEPTKHEVYCTFNCRQYERLRYKYMSFISPKMDDEYCKSTYNSPLYDTEVFYETFDPDKYVEEYLKFKQLNTEELETTAIKSMFIADNSAYLKNFFSHSKGVVTPKMAEDLYSKIEAFHYDDDEQFNSYANALIDAFMMDKTIVWVAATVAEPEKEDESV